MCEPARPAVLEIDEPLREHAHCRMVRREEVVIRAHLRERGMLGTEYQVLKRCAVRR